MVSNYSVSEQLTAYMMSTYGLTKEAVEEINAAMADLSHPLNSWIVGVAPGEVCRDTLVAAYRLRETNS